MSCAVDVAVTFECVGVVLVLEDVEGEAEVDNEWTSRVMDCRAAGRGDGSSLKDARKRTRTNSRTPKANTALQNIVASSSAERMWILIIAEADRSK